MVSKCQNDKRVWEVGGNVYEKVWISLGGKQMLTVKQVQTPIII
jgi:hypothetical protein